MTAHRYRCPDCDVMWTSHVPEDLCWCCGARKGVTATPTRFMPYYIWTAMSHRPNRRQ